MMRDSNNGYKEMKKIITQQLGVEQYRHNMCLDAIKYGVSKTARLYGTSRPTVYKWLKIFQANGAVGGVGLKNLSRKDQYHPNKLDVATVEKIIKYRNKTKLGAYYIKEDLGLECSEKTIHKKLKQNNLISKPKTKHRKKKDMSKMRAETPVLYKLQIDVKYLTDIPNIYPFISSSRRVRYQITCRDYKSGLTYVGFSYNKDSTSIGMFVSYIIYHLKKAGVDVSKLHFQSDNGSEFRTPCKKKGFSLYEEILNKNDIAYIFNPVARPTYNSDVESFHNRIEKELYDIDKFYNDKMFLLKVWKYMVWYNTLRKNRNKNKCSPAQILRENGVQNVDYLTTVKPIYLDIYCKNIILVKENVNFKWSAVNNM